MAWTTAELLRGPGPAAAPWLGERISAQPVRALQGLPVGTMRGRELPFVLLALVLCQATRGPAAPVPAAGDTVLAKMYPRGNHWAVGECSVGASPWRDKPALGGPPPHLSAFLGPGFGAGFAPTFLPKRQRLPPKTPPHPSPSWEAVGPSAAAGWSLDLPSPPGYQCAALQTLRKDHLPSAPTQHLFTDTIFALNNFGKPGA